MSSKVFASALVGALLLGTSPAAMAADLVIWWTKGVTEDEENALKAVVTKWEEQTGKTVDLSFYGSGDTEAKTIAALEAGSPPDLTFDYAYDLAFSPTWAYQRVA